MSSGADGVNRGSGFFFDDRHFAFLALSASLLGPCALSSTPHTPKKSRISFLKSSPGGNIVLFDIDIVPVMKTMDGGIVQFVVENGSSVILNGILDGGKRNNDNKWDGVQSRIDSAEDGEGLDTRVKRLELDKGRLDETRVN